MTPRVRAGPEDPPVRAGDEEQLDYGPSSVGMGRLAALALCVLLLFAICTLGFWVAVFAANDAFCFVGSC